MLNKIIDKNLDNLLSKEETISLNKESIHIDEFVNDFDLEYFLSKNDERYLFPRKKHDEELLSEEIFYDKDIIIHRKDNGNITHKITIKAGLITKVWQLALFFPKHYGDMFIGVYRYLKHSNLPIPPYVYNITHDITRDEKIISIHEIVEYNIISEITSINLSDFVKYYDYIKTNVKYVSIGIYIKNINDTNNVFNLTKEMFSGTNKTFTLKGSKKFSPENVNSLLGHVINLNLWNLKIDYMLIDNLHTIMYIEDEESLRFITNYSGKRVVINDEQLFLYNESCKNPIVFNKLTNLNTKIDDITSLKIKAIEQRGRRFDNYFNGKYNLLSDDDLLFIYKNNEYYYNSSHNFRFDYVLYKRLGIALSNFNNYNNKPTEFVRSFDKNDEWFDDIYGFVVKFVFDQLSRNYYKTMNDVESFLDLLKIIIDKDSYRKKSILSKTYATIIKYILVKSTEHKLSVAAISMLFDNCFIPLVGDIDIKLIEGVSAMCNADAKVKLNSILLG